VPPEVLDDAGLVVAVGAGEVLGLPVHGHHVVAQVMRLQPAVLALVALVPAEGAE
jgi:hypothetical protein